MGGSLKTELLFISPLILFACASADKAQSDYNRPNILIAMGDDISWPDG